MDKTFKLLQCDEPTPYTGRIYPREEMEKAIQKFKEEKVDKGIAYGTLDQSSPTMLLIDISHRVTDITINEKGEVIADIEILDTPKGQIAKELIDNLRLSPCMHGHVSDELEVSDCTVFHTSLLEKENEADDE